MRKTTKKKIPIIVSCVILVLLLIDILVSNYLVSFAIGRSTSGGASVVPPSSTTSATKTLVSENRKLISAKTEQWRKQNSSEVIEITSSDGLLLKAEKWQTDPNSHLWAILVHGYTASRKMMPDYACMFAQYGYNLLAPDLRGHGESDGQYIGMGWLDKNDIIQWIDLICENDPNAQIVLFGISMGAATVMMTSGETLPSNVKAVVEDCGYTSVWDIFADEMHVLFHLPTFPLLHTASIISTIRAGYNFTEASALHQVEKTQLPIFFIHGSEDNFVHTEMVYRLYDVCPTRKDLLVVENAGHGQSFYYAPEEYETRVFSFLSTYVQANS